VHSVRDVPVMQQGFGFPQQQGFGFPQQQGFGLPQQTFGQPNMFGNNFGQFGGF